MKAAVVLVGMSLALAAVAAVGQVRTQAQPSTPPSPSVARGVHLEDPQITQIKRQLAEMRQDIADLQKKNSDLDHCLRELRERVRLLDTPGAQYDDDVTVGKPTNLMAPKCD
jgi:hypothetical protein